MNTYIVYVNDKIVEKDYILFYRIEWLDNHSIYEIVHKLLYSASIDDINLYDNFYIKIGHHVTHNTEIWNDIMKYKLSSLDIIELIDKNKINKLMSSDHIILDYDIHKQKIHNIITNIYYN